VRSRAIPTDLLGTAGGPFPVHVVVGLNRFQHLTGLARPHDHRRPATMQVDTDELGARVRSHQGLLLVEAEASSIRSRGHEERGPLLHRIKNDVRDASDRADLLRMGRLPEAWIAPPSTRELRELVRLRARLVALLSHDLGNEHRAQDRADHGDRLHRGAAGVPGQTPADHPDEQVDANSSASISRSGDATLAAKGDGRSSVSSSGSRRIVGLDTRLRAQRS
jgi:hypothetical protein